MRKSNAVIRFLKIVGKYTFWLGKKAQSSINNRRIKTKTTYLYVFCVMLPVLFTNAFIIGTTVSAFREEEENINNIASSVTQEISSLLESAVYASIDLYTITEKSERLYQENQRFIV